MSDLNNTTVINESSQDCLPSILSNGIDGLPFFFLDAHGDGFEWPLRSEIEEITTEINEGFILIDDCQVPEEPQFGFDEYDGQTCSLAYVEDNFDNSKNYSVLYPTYNIRTSNHHPLRGYVIIGVNRDLDLIPAPLLENFNLKSNLLS